MSTVLEQIDWDAMILSIQETLFMTFFSLLIAVVLGFGLGIILYVTKDDGLYPNKIINRILDFIVNLLRAVPFIILIIILLPVTIFLVGTMLGAKAALPALIISSAPFYARMCMIALSEVDKGTGDGSKPFTNYYQSSYPRSQASFNIKYHSNGNFARWIYSNGGMYWCWRTWKCGLHVWICKTKHGSHVYCNILCISYCLYYTGNRRLCCQKN